MRRPQPNRVQTVHLQCPDGLNLADPASTLGPESAMFMVNMIRAEYGLRSRMGFVEWVTELGGPVLTVIPYAGSIGSRDRLFAATFTGIWDCTDSTSTPTQVLAFGNSGENSGRCTFTTFTSEGGKKFLLCCDETNGLLLYDEESNTWSSMVEGTGERQISGVNPNDFVFTMAWKNRLWFVERGTCTAWYLPLGQIAGVAASFDFGTKLKYGGELVGLWSWTQDGGFGVDDFLVAVSTAGDVAVYQGTDPGDASYFALKGVWYVGSVPAGRRIATDTGGDLLLLTPLGIMALSSLVGGGEKLNPNMYASRQVKPLVNTLMATKRTSLGWDMRLHPVDNSLIVIVPKFNEDAFDQQLVLNMTNKGWSTYQGLPMLCAETWHGSLYFGTADGRVCINQGYSDNVALDGSGATKINWGFLGSFQELGKSCQKMVKLLRPDFVTFGSKPGYSISARFDFDLSDISTGSDVPVDDSSGVIWDVSKWDVAKWAGGTGTSGYFGVAPGIGSHVAILLVGSSIGKIVYLGCSLTWEMGGVL
jgi:hypothetical protein